jgi:hypothetical protein
MENLNINFGELIKNVAVDMYGHQIGDKERAATYADGASLKRAMRNIDERLRSEV